MTDKTDIPCRFNIDLSQDSRPCSPILFGIFLEDLNHAIEGGFSAELVKNRNFNAPELLGGWSLVCDPGCEGTMGPAYIPDERPHNPWQLRLQISEAPNGRVGIANDGFWGIAIQKGETYRLRVKHRLGLAADALLTATLETPGGEILASTQLPPPQNAGDGLATCILVARESCANARLILAADRPATIWFSHVSLVPEARWSGSKLPVRKDLVEAIAELKPSFIRYPGGCVVEGDRLEEAFRWKDSIGNPIDRKGHWNRWGYFSTNSFGYHEYLQFCEDINAIPLFVVNAGMSHTDVVPEEKFPACIQDTLDAIEYANGPADSVWGAKRAENGHPAPFNLKHIEIGNENGGPVYLRNYPLLFEAIKGAHPDIEIISNVSEPGGRVEIVDEHYFEDFTKLARMASRYDTYPREGPRIYVGEYASPPNSGLGNLRAALAEAAFMTGIERNSDIVVMASYAPLLVHVADRHWELCAICFDGSRFYSTPSYYIQKLFSQYRCANMFPIQLEGQAMLEKDCSGLAVSFGTNSDGQFFLKVVNLTPDAHRAGICIKNSGSLNTIAKVITLSADSLDAENSLNHPTRIVPLEEKFQGVAPEFEYAFPPHSFTLLIMDQAKRSI